MRTKNQNKSLNGRFVIVLIITVLIAGTINSVGLVNAQYDWLNNYASSQSDPKALSNCTLGDYSGGFALGSWVLKVISEDSGICNMEYSWEIEGSYTEYECRILTEKIKTTDWNSTAVPLEQSLVDNYCILVNEGNFFFDIMENRTITYVYLLSNPPLHPPGTIFALPYSITNATLDEIKIEIPNIIIEIISNDNGTLKIDIPKTLHYVQRNEEPTRGHFIIIDGEEIFAEQIDNNCFVSYSIPFAKGSRSIEILSSFTPDNTPIIPYKPSTNCIPKVIQGGLSPLKQIANEVLPKDVVCREKLQLIFKSSDGSPACVKSTTIPKLIERGWYVIPVSSIHNSELSIRTGTFGFWIKSQNVITITSEKIIFSEMNRNLAGPPLDPPKETMISKQDWKNLTDLIDFQNFNLLPDTIGDCLGCTDSPIVWIEISNSTVTKKISFEPQENIREITDFRDKLQEIIQSAKDSMNKTQ